MHRSLVGVVLLALLGFAVAGRIVPVGRPQITRVDDRVNAPQGDWCEACAVFMQSQIDELIQIIFNVGIQDGCGAICSLLSSNILSEVCGVLCEIEGVQVFEQLINDADPDPIWVCMELGQCPIVDTATGRFTSVQLVPSVAKQGDTVSLNAQYKIINATGVGELAFAVIPPASDGGNGVGDAEIFDKLAPGTYNAQFQFQIQPSQDEPWNAGFYQVEIALCEGSCGSTHSHSYLLDQRSYTLKVTGSN